MNEMIITNAEFGSIRIEMRNGERITQLGNSNGKLASSPLILP